MRIENTRSPDTRDINKTTHGENALGRVSSPVVVKYAVEANCAIGLLAYTE